MLAWVVVTGASTVLLDAGVAASGPIACDETVTRRVSISDDEAPARRESVLPSVSEDGRFVAFASRARNLVPGDDNRDFDVFVRDRIEGTTEIVSVDSSGEIGDATSTAPAISATGRYVVFNSTSSNFVPGDVDPSGEGALEVFFHDRESGVTERVAVDSAEDYVPVPSFGADVSDSGRFVAFTAAAALDPDDGNETFDIYVRDRVAGTTEVLSVPASGPHRNVPSLFPSISSTGQYVAFDSSQRRLVDDDSNRWNDVFVADRAAGTVERVSVDSDGGQARRGSSSPAISGDGRFVAFESIAGDLVPHDGNGAVSDVFLHDRVSGRTSLVSRSTHGRRSPGPSGGPSISEDGTRVAFSSLGAKLVPGDTNDAWDVFVRDRVAGTTTRVSVGPQGRQAVGNREPHYGADISSDGRLVAFESTAHNLVPRDENRAADVFVHGPPASCPA
jgi:Tol biopolymer transport system component